MDTLTCKACVFRPNTKNPTKNLPWPENSRTKVCPCGLYLHSNIYSPLVAMQPTFTRLPIPAQASIQWRCHRWQPTCFFRYLNKLSIMFPRGRQASSSRGHICPTCFFITGLYSKSLVSPCCHNKFSYSALINSKTAGGYSKIILPPT